MLAVTRVGGEAEAAMMTDVTHAVTEMVITTVEDEEAGLALALARLRETIVLVRIVTAEIAETVRTDSPRTTAVDGMMIAVKPGLMALHRLLKMKGTVAPYSFSSSQLA